MDYQRELLGGSSFLDRYEEQLSSLCRNQRFINMISLASKEAAEKTGSDTGKAGKNIISDTLFRERAYLLLPEYAHIVDDVARSGYSKKSAVLSIYYCCQNSECFLLLRKLFGCHRRTNRQPPSKIIMFRIHRMRTLDEFGRR